MAYKTVRPSVWFLTHAAGTPRLGPNLRVFSIAKELAKDGFHASIIGSGTFHKYVVERVSEEPVATAVVDGVNMVWLKTVPYRHRNVSHVINQLEFPWRVFRRWRDLELPDPDVIVASSPPPFIAFAAGYLARRWNVPWVFEMRDLWPLVIREISGASALNPYISLLKVTERFAVTNADHLVTVKAADADYLAESYDIAGRTTYIPNGVDPETLRFTDPPGKDVLPQIDGGTVKVVYVGSLTAYYLLDEFLGAYHRLRERGADVSAIIAGDGPRRGALERLVRRQGTPDVHFLGRIERGAVLPLLRSCDIGFVGLRGAVANRFGVSSNKLFEYMYAPIAVLACYESDHDPVLEAGCGITVKERTADAIESGLARLASLSESERSRLAERGRDFVMKHHHLPDLARRYGDLLTALQDRAAS